MLLIKEACANAKKVVIIGASFIGSECAASLKQEFKDNIEIDMVDIANVPFERTLGKEVGQAIQLMHEKNGVRFSGGAMIKEITKDEDGKVKSVVFQDGKTLEADMVIMATGVRPNTKYLEGSGIDLAKDGGIVCDPYLETNVKDVFAAGDVASYPYWPTGARTRTEHWSSALDMGTNAAFNMLDKYVPYADVPFFWTRHYN